MAYNRLPELVHQANVTGLAKAQEKHKIADRKAVVVVNNQPEEEMIFARIFDLDAKGDEKGLMAFYEACYPDDSYVVSEMIARDKRYTAWLEKRNQ